MLWSGLYTRITFQIIFFGRQEINVDRNDSGNNEGSLHSLSFLVNVVSNSLQ